MLANQLTNSGHDVTKMVTPHIPIKNLKNPSFAVLGTIKSVLNQEKYDIVHAFNVPSAFAMHYSKGKKKVLSIHGVFSDQIEKLHSKTLSTIAIKTESKVLPWADALTTDSIFTQKLYKEKLGFHVEYLPSPIDSKELDKIPNVTKNEKQIIYLGRDSYEKGIDILKKIEGKLNGNVVYCTNLPWKEAMMELKKSSVLIVPSRIESLPTTIKEAFYLKIPVIGTNVGGIPELIDNNKTGLLVSENDHDKIIELTNSLLYNNKVSSDLTENAYEFVQQHMTWERVLSKYIDFYKNLLK